MPAPAPIIDRWTDIRRTIRDEIGEDSYQSWVGLLALDSYEAGTVRIAAPNRFICDRVYDRYGARLSELWCGGVPKVKAMALIVAGDHPMGATSARPAAMPKPAPKRRLSGLSAAAEPESLQRPVPANPTFLDQRYVFDNFVVGKSNELAHAAARRVAEAETPANGFNPLFLYGGSGLGKTHLMHAIAWEAQARDPSRRVIYVTAERFMHRFVSSLRYKDTFAFKDEFRTTDLLLVDDFQFIGGKDSTQEEFFHTFNALIDQNRQIVISADCSPTDLKEVEERIKSRLSWGLVTDIAPTDYELRLGILQSKAEAAAANDPSLHFHPKVLEFVAHKIVANVRVLEGALNRLIAQASLTGREVTLELAQDLLADLVRSHDRRLTIEEIQRKVAEHFNVKLSDMLSPRRARAIARPRHVAIYLAKELTDKSLPEIGRRFGGRDHTTIMHAIKRITALRKEDRSLDEDVSMLLRALRST